MTKKNYVKYNYFYVFNVYDVMLNNCIKMAWNEMTKKNLTKVGDIKFQVGLFMCKVRLKPMKCSTVPHRCNCENYDRSKMWSYKKYFYGISFQSKGIPSFVRHKIQSLPVPSLPSPKIPWMSIWVRVETIVMFQAVLKLFRYNLCFKLHTFFFFNWPHNGKCFLEFHTDRIENK